MSTPHSQSALPPASDAIPHVSAEAQPPFAQSATRPLWLRGAERAKDKPLRDLQPPRKMGLRPFTLWALLDHPISTVSYRIEAGTTSRHSWLGLHQLVARPADRAPAEAALVQALLAGGPTHGASFGRDLQPPSLPEHPHYCLAKPISKHARCDIDLLVSRSLCCFAEALVAQGQRAVLEVQVSLTRIRPGFGDALEAFFHVQLQQPRPSLAKSPKANKSYIQTKRRLHEIIRDMGEITATLAIYTDTPIPPRDLQWVLRQQEQTMDPIGSWTEDPAAAQNHVDVFFLDDVMGMLHPTAAKLDAR